MEGEVGNAIIVPLGTNARMCVRAVTAVVCAAVAWSAVTVAANPIRSLMPGPNLGFA